MKVLQLTAYGDPKDVVQLVEEPDFGPLAPDEWVIDMEAAPVPPTDQYIIAGFYGDLPPLPHGLGCEGVGRVSAVGEGVKHVKVGDRVIAPMLQNATWATRIKTRETWQRALPDGDLGQMAQVSMNPVTAFLILTEFKTLKPGDWVISTAANSAVGRSVIAIAKARGVKTVNIVRSPTLVEEIKALGADLVLTDGPDLAMRIKEATDGADIQLALDGVGGALTQQLVDALGLYGAVVLWRCRLDHRDYPGTFHGEVSARILDRKLVEDSWKSRTPHGCLRRDRSFGRVGQAGYSGGWGIRVGSIH